MRWACLLASGWCLAACIEANLEPCGDLLCPPDTVCLADRGTCASPESLAVCADEPDGTLCAAGSVDGSCAQGLCIASSCGDGIATGREQCDGADITLACTDFRFYAGSLGCTPSCLYDTSACAGFCGDGVVQEDTEVCDASPVLQCVELGYDYGHNRCSAACSDTNAFDCGRLAPRAIQLVTGYLISPLDVLVEPGLILATYSVELYVVRNGQTSRLAGDGLIKIAERGGRVWVAGKGAVFELVGDQLVATPDIGLPGEQLTIAVTSAGQLWALSQATCAVRELVGGAWQVRAAVPGSTCSALYTDGAGNVLAVAPASYPYSLAFHWDGSAWQALTFGGSVTSINDGRAGKLLAATTGGLYELDGATKTQLFGGSFNDAIAIGNQFVTGSSRIGVTGPTVPLSLQALPGYSSLRRMPDGDTYMLGGTAIAARIGAYSSSTSTASSGVRGAVALPTKQFVMWNSTQVFDGTTTSTPGGTLRGVAVAPNGQLVVASSSGVITGPLGGGFVTDARVIPKSLSVGTDGTIAIADDTTIRVLTPGAPQWVTIYTSVSMELVGPVVAVTASEVYYATSGFLLGAHVFRWNGTTAVNVANGITIGFTGFGFVSGARLDDGTIAFAGGTLLAGRDTTWQSLGGGGQNSTVSGTSPSDVWFTDVAASPYTSPGLAHWDGASLANVRWFGSGTPGGVAATPDLVRVTGTDAYGTYVRW